MEKNKRSLEAKVPEFVREIGRVKPGNDRRHSRKVERLVKRMDPMELAELLGQVDAEETDAQREGPVSSDEPTT